MKFKTVKIIGAVILAFLLASGCGKRTENTPAPDSTAARSEETVPEQKETAASGDVSASGTEASADQNLILEEEAKSIALEDAGLTEDQISGIRIRLEKDDGIQQYEVEFYAGDKEYDYEIDAASGNILGRDMEIEDDFRESGTSDAGVSEEQAKKTALQKVPGAGENDIKIHLDEDDGKAVYEGSFIYKDRKYEFEIDADSGEILDWEEESVYD